MFFFALTIIMIPMGGVFANQFALANRRDKEYAIPVVIGHNWISFSSYIDRPYILQSTVAILTTEL